MDGWEIGRIDAQSGGTTLRPNCRYQRHRRGTSNRLGQTIGRVFEPQELFAILEGAFSLPAIMPPKRGVYIGPPRRLRHLSRRTEVCESHSSSRGLGLINCAKPCSSDQPRGHVRKRLIRSCRRHQPRSPTGRPESVASRMDPSDADPAVEGGLRHLQLPGQIREQPLVLTQDARFRHDTRTGTAYDHAWRVNRPGYCS